MVQTIIFRSFFVFYFFGHTARHVELFGLGIKPCALQWKCRVLTPGPPGKSPLGVPEPLNGGDLAQQD